MDKQLRLRWSRERRQMKEEIDYLRDLCWSLSRGDVQVFGGDCEDETCDCPEIEVREEETVEKTPIDSFVRTMLNEVE